MLELALACTQDIGTIITIIITTNKFYVQEYNYTSGGAEGLGPTIRHDMLKSSHRCSSCMHKLRLIRRGELQCSIKWQKPARPFDKDHPCNCSFLYFFSPRKIGDAFFSNPFKDHRIRCQAILVGLSSSLSAGCAAACTGPISFFFSYLQPQN